MRKKQPNLALVILAAGEGKRMKSKVPKVLHMLCGRPMLEYAVELAHGLKPAEVIIVTRPDTEQFSKFQDRAHLVPQTAPLGTADAVRQAEPALNSFEGDVLILCGDTPLLTQATVQKLVNAHRQLQAAVTLLTAVAADPRGYGRIVRDSAGDVQAIIEENDCSREQRQIKEINAGTYIFEKRKLFSVLPKVTTDNKQREFYLPDCVAILRGQSEKIQAVEADETEITGINSRKELAFAERILRDRINTGWMERGVTITDPTSTFIDSEVTIGNDTVVYPFTFLEGKTSVGPGSKVGPLVRLVDTKVGGNVEIQNSVVRDSEIEDEAVVGPFAHIRPGTLVKRKAKVGTFVEIKKSEIGWASKVPHLSYIGDATIGKDANIGAGTITCNYDGVNKYKTIIEDGAFVGSDTQLVAPVKIGKNAVTGAGSTITKNVPDNSLALERTNQRIIDGWSEKRLKKKRETKNNRKG